MTERRIGVQHVQGELITSSEDNLQIVYDTLCKKRTVLNFEIMFVSRGKWRARYYFSYGPCKNDNAQWSDTMKLFQTLHAKVRMEHWLTKDWWEASIVEESPPPPAPIHRLVIESDSEMRIIDEG